MHVWIFPPSICPLTLAGKGQPISPDGTCVTELSRNFFARPCRSLKWLIVTSGHDKCSGWRLLCLRGISTIGRRGRHGFDWESAGIPVWGFTRALHAKRNVKPRGALASYFWPTALFSAKSGWERVAYSAPSNVIMLPLMHSYNPISFYYKHNIHLNRFPLVPVVCQIPSNQLSSGIILKVIGWWHA